MRCAWLGFVVLTTACYSGEQSNELNVLGGKVGEHRAGDMVERYLLAHANLAFARRAEAFEKLQTAEDCSARQAELKKYFISAFGGFPERTPLNPQVVAKIERDGYRLEKIIFESQPKHFVTALLYLPNTPPPYPAVLVPCGHSQNGKAHDAYQRLPILLARNGMAAMCFDPVGQGERYQFLNDDGKPFGATIEHTIIGMSCVPLGLNTSRYEIWDGMRALDYLCSRPEIDSKRLGCAGTSGGGTQTSYLMALDERISAAAPCCYITTVKRLWETIGAADAEQNIFGQVTQGLDQGDFLFMHAPQPVMIGAATKDFFDIGGTWQSFREAKRTYARFGFSERADIFEGDLDHNLAAPTRVAVTRFMRRWLLKNEDPVTEPELAILKETETYCTPKGQVMQLEGARSVLDLNRDIEAKLAAERAQAWKDNVADWPQRVRQAAGIKALGEIPTGSVSELGSLERFGAPVKKLVLKPEAGIELPALLFNPGGKGQRCLYVHGDGKHSDAQAGGAIEALVKAGGMVLAVDLRGLGETRTSRGTRNAWTDLISPDWKDFYMAYCQSRSLVAMRTEDVLYAARYLAGLEPRGTVHAVGIGVGGVPVLHAAALEPGLIKEATLRHTLHSWSAVVRAQVPKQQLSNLIHGALRVYDLPDLVKLSGARIKIEAPVGAQGEALE